jgi:Arc/MetJ family transcription regulator
MARTIIDIDEEKLARAQRALRTSTKRDTVNAALELAAAVDAQQRSAALDAFRELLGRMDLDAIERNEIDDHDVHPGRHLHGRQAASWTRGPASLD